MHPPRFRVRTLLVAVGVVALLFWHVMMGSRSFHYYKLAREYSANERGWRDIAARHRETGEFGTHGAQCVEYFAQLTLKYRRAMWRPWTSVAPDPHAPGFDQWLEQERRAKEVAPRSSPASESSTTN